MGEGVGGEHSCQYAVSSLCLLAKYIVNLLSEVFLAEHSYDIKISILRISGPNLPLKVG